MIYAAHNDNNTCDVIDLDIMALAETLGHKMPDDMDPIVHLVELRQKTAYFRNTGLSSIFDKESLPKGKDWEYYRIPKETELPVGLAIVKDQFNTKFQSTHYTIAPAYDMTLAQFKSLLGVLAQRIIKEAV